MRSPFALVLLAFSLAAHAQVYRWTDERGKVHYGDHPAEGDKAKPVDIGRMDSSSSGGATSADVRVKETEVEWFVVRGVTRQEIRDTMQQTAPYSEVHKARVWGQCAWRISWSFQHERDATSCRVHRMRLEVSAVMRLPRWQDEALAEPDLRARWSDFNRRLRQHEDGHKKNGIAAAEDLARRLRGLREFATCEALNAEIVATRNRVLSEYRQVDQAFDRVERLYLTGF